MVSTIPSALGEMGTHGDDSHASRYTPLPLGRFPRNPRQQDTEHRQIRTHSKVRSHARQQGRIESPDCTLRKPAIQKSARPLIEELLQFSAHPNPQHILIPINHTIQKPSHLLDRDSRPESIRRDEIRAFGVEFMPVDLKVPVVSRGDALVELSLSDGEFVEDDCAEAGAFCEGC